MKTKQRKTVRYYRPERHRKYVPSPAAENHWKRSNPGQARYNSLADQESTSLLWFSLALMALGTIPVIVFRVLLYLNPELFQIDITP